LSSKNWQIWVLSIYVHDSSTEQVGTLLIFSLELPILFKKLSYRYSLDMDVHPGISNASSFLEFPELLGDPSR